MAEISQIERVAIEKLIPYVNNAKEHSEEQIIKIASSIREFGFVNPVLIDKELNIIAGHGRVMAAKKLKMSEVPCVFVEGLSDAQRKAYILADNRLGELAGWDMELVKSELEILLENDFDIDVTGFELPEEPKNQDETDPEEDELEDVEKLEKHYGVPYQGNKSRIADIIISLLPEGKRLVDLFGGAVQSRIVPCFRVNGKIIYTTI